MNSSAIAKKFYKDIGAKGLKDIARDFDVGDDLPVIKKFLTKKDRILDIACGYGRVTLPLAKHGFDTAGVDISPNLIAAAKKDARKQGLKVLFKVGNMMKLPFADETFTKAVCLWNSFNDLLSTREQLKALREFYRILKPGGICFIIMINGERRDLKKILRKNGFGEERRMWKDELNGVETMMYVHDKNSILRLLKKSLFKKFSVRFINIRGRRRIGLFLTR